MRTYLEASAFAATLVAGALIAAPADAQEGYGDGGFGGYGAGPRLHGSYGFTLSEFCVESPRQAPPVQAFDPDTRELLQDADAVTAVLNGIMRFHQRGQVFIEDTTISDLFIDTTQAGDVPIAIGTAVSCEGTYVVDWDRRVEITVDCSAELPNDVSVVIGPFELKGFVGRYGLTIPLSSNVGNIQTETVSVGGIVVGQRERVCLLRGTLAKL